MKYRNDKHGNPLSILGYGCMRFPQKLGRIDIVETEKQIMTAYEMGVNYYDTAYIYPGSEVALGEILEKNNIRKEVSIATKMPHYLVKNTKDFDKIFNQQLKHLRTDYIDYYLIHMLPDVDTWERLKGLGILEWIDEKKASGAIRQIGFSYHGNTDKFCDLIDVYDWEFCQIQYNYLDENSQAGRRGMKYASEKGIPVIIMEPLRGGKLVNGLPEDAKKIFDEYEVKSTPAQWAFRWLWDQPEITVVLSGMNSHEMVVENIETASAVEVGKMTDKDFEMLEEVVKAINSKMKVGCTGCGYCMPCPMGVDIPATFAAYNCCYSEGKFWALIDYLKCTAIRKSSTAASNCVKCGKCEEHCPQNIEIRKQLDAARKTLETPVYKIARKIIELFVHL